MKVLLCGPIAEQGKPALGGYQSANLRLARLFSSLSYDVEPLPYPVPHGSLFKKSLAYLSGFSHIVQSLMRYRRRAVLHITPLCKQFLPFELGLVLTAKMRGLKVVVDLRAGNQIELYNERSSAYRTMFRTMLRQADAVTYEGERYARFIADIAPGIPRKLLPNFVPTGLPRTKDTPRPAGGPVMIYVGQLSESKGVFQALEIFHEVRRHAPDALFYLVGADTGTVTRVIQEKMSDAHRGVVFTGSLPFDEIVPLLDAADFFLFLTRFPGEGHSNALTEAMARGCVPVCTRHGFNADVIARSGIVIEAGTTAAAAAERILACWESHEWRELSRDAVRRVEHLFTQAAVAASLNEIYQLCTKRTLMNCGLEHTSTSNDAEECQAHHISKQ